MRRLFCYGPLILRSTLVPVANIGSSFGADGDYEFVEAGVDFQEQKKVRGI
ncbi:hypothetical protein AGMMS50268_17760 [Spirochaetia bacterium]|nr:hypothetical protein AGMMS50268_17760 [Spirochaetia bacterium]